jgi:hypothetical protein
MFLCIWCFAQVVSARSYSGGLHVMLWLVVRLVRFEGVPGV